MEQIKHEKRIKTGTWNIISTYLFFLSMNTDHVPNCGFMSNSGTAFSVKTQSSYGSDAIDHLTADGAGFAGGQVAIVALLEVDADLIGGLHLELLHTLLGLGDIDPVAGRIVAAHNRSLLLSFQEAARFLKETNRFLWEYYVPRTERYEWRVAEKLENENICSDPG